MVRWCATQASHQRPRVGAPPRAQPITARKLIVIANLSYQTERKIHRTERTTSLVGRNGQNTSSVQGIQLNGASTNASTRTKIVPRSQPQPRLVLSQPAGAIFLDHRCSCPRRSSPRKSPYSPAMADLDGHYDAMLIALTDAHPKESRDVANTHNKNIESNRSQRKQSLANETDRRTHYWKENHRKLLNESHEKLFPGQPLDSDRFPNL